MIRAEKLRPSIKHLFQVVVRLPIKPHYEIAEEMGKNALNDPDTLDTEPERASTLEVASRIAAINTDAPWQIVVDVMRSHERITIEAEASELIENKVYPEQSWVAYTIDVKFFESPLTEYIGKDPNNGKPLYKYLLDDEGKIRYLSDDVARILKENKLEFKSSDKRW